MRLGIQTVTATVLLLLLLGSLSVVQGVGLVQLTINTAGDYDPVISTDGLKVAFTSNVDGDLEIFVVNSDGTGRRQLTSNNANDTSPAISGNGGRIVFQSASGNDADIWVVNSDGTGLSPLTGAHPQWNNLDEGAPTISGDGQWVAFVSSDNPLGLNPEGDDEIFLIRTDGTSLRQLTTNNSRDDRNPSITSDGAKVAFQQNLGTWEIFVVNSDGTGLTQVTTNAGSIDPSSSVSISGDGTNIAFDSRAPAVESSRDISRAGQQLLPSSQVYVVSAAGSNPAQVSATGGDNLTPRLSGDGRKVGYVSNGDGDLEIFAVNSDGTGLTRVTDNAAIDAGPSLDQHGNRVVFASNLDGDFDIYIATLRCINGDVNNDGAVNIDDLAAVGAAFGTTVGDPRYNPDADLNSDGSVNIDDLATVGSNFGRTC